MTAIAAASVTGLRLAAQMAELSYESHRRMVLIAESPQGWADVLDLAASWGHAARAWLAMEHDTRADLKCWVMEEAMQKALSRSAAEKVCEEHPEYREAVSRMREAERMVALADARQRQADLWALAALK